MFNGLVVGMACFATKFKESSHLVLSVGFIELFQFLLSSFQLNLIFLDHCLKLVLLLLVNKQNNPLKHHYLGVHNQSVGEYLFLSFNFSNQAMNQVIKPEQKLFRYFLNISVR